MHVFIFLLISHGIQIHAMDSNRIANISDPSVARQEFLGNMALYSMTFAISYPLLRLFVCDPIYRSIQRKKIRKLRDEYNAISGMKVQAIDKKRKLLTHMQEIVRVKLNHNDPNLHGDHSYEATHAIILDKSDIEFDNAISRQRNVLYRAERHALQKPNPKKKIGKYKRVKPIALLPVHVPKKQKLPESY